MSSTRGKPATFVRRENAPSAAVVAVVIADELQAAKHDRRVRAFIEEADAYLVALDQQDRNR